MDKIWVQVESGIEFDLIAPRADQVVLADIACALARIPRFNGHTSIDLEPWSVAQHSLLVESLMPEGSSPNSRLVALLHDGHEAYVGDLITPVGWMLDHKHERLLIEGSRPPPHQYVVGERPSFYWMRAVTNIDAAVFSAFGLMTNAVQTLEIKRADMLALAIEKERLMAPSTTAWPILPPLPDPCPELSPLPWRDAMKAFLDRFDALMRERHGLA